MKFLSLVFIFSLHFSVQAQISNTFFGLSRLNTPDAEVYLATVNPSTGVVTNLSSTPISNIVNLTGAALDPYNQSYHYLGMDTMYSVSLINGNLLYKAATNSTLAGAMFDNFRFNNSDTTLYGLARQVLYDSVTSTYTNTMYLATINPQNGTITTISNNSIGQGFALAGSAINPYLKVYYYSDGSNIIGLDMFNGSVYSSSPITITNGIVFDNFTYSCADSSLYGLIRQNYYDSIWDPNLMQYDVFVDSTTIHLGKINPNTGVVTTISPYSIAEGGYSLNAGSTIDPSTMTYYYNNGNALVGVNMVSGLIVSSPSLNFSTGQYLDLMRIQSNCFNAKNPIRLPGNPSSIQRVETQEQFNLYPNPSSGKLVIEGNTDIDQVIIKNLSGQIVQRIPVKQLRTVSVQTEHITQGVYLIDIVSKSGKHDVRKWVKE